MFRIFFDPIDDVHYECEVETLSELGADACDQPAPYLLEDPENGDNVRLCAEHKEAAKAKGLAR